MNTTTLEQRIAKALGSNDVRATDIAALLAETETAADAADGAAAKAKAEALDPALSPDPKQAHEAMSVATFTRDRLQTLLPRLREKHKEAAAKEYIADWRADYERVEAKRDVMAQELAERYPILVAELVGLMQRIPAIKASVHHINSHAPPGVRDRLTEVVSPRDLQLPKLAPKAGEYQFEWPPRQPSLAEQWANISIPVPTHPGADWQKSLEERDRRVMEDGKRLSEFYENREREAEKQRLAKIREREDWEKRWQAWRVGNGPKPEPLPME